MNYIDRVKKVTNEAIRHSRMAKRVFEDTEATESLLKRSGNNKNFTNDIDLVYAAYKAAYENPKLLDKIDKEYSFKATKESKFFGYVPEYNPITEAIKKDANADSGLSDEAKSKVAKFFIKNSIRYAAIAGASSALGFATPAIGFYFAKRAFGSAISSFLSKTGILSSIADSIKRTASKLSSALGLDKYKNSKVAKVAKYAAIGVAATLSMAATAAGVDIPDTGVGVGEPINAHSSYTEAVESTIHHDLFDEDAMELLEETYSSYEKVHTELSETYPELHHIDINKAALTTEGVDDLKEILSKDDFVELMTQQTGKDEDFVLFAYDIPDSSSVLSLTVSENYRDSLSSAKEDLLKKAEEIQLKEEQEVTDKKEVNNDDISDVVLEKETISPLLEESTTESNEVTPLEVSYDDHIVQKGDIFWTLVQDDAIETGLNIEGNNLERLSYIMHEQAKLDHPNIDFAKISPGQSLPLPSFEKPEDVLSYLKEIDTVSARNLLAELEVNNPSLDFTSASQEHTNVNMKSLEESDVFNMKISDLENNFKGHPTNIYDGGSSKIDGAFKEASFHDRIKGEYVEIKSDYEVQGSSKITSDRSQYSEPTTDITKYHTAEYEVQGSSRDPESSSDYYEKIRAGSVEVKSDYEIQGKSKIPSDTHQYSEPIIDTAQNHKSEHEPQGVETSSSAPNHSEDYSSVVIEDGEVVSETKKHNPFSDKINDIKEKIEEVISKKNEHAGKYSPETKKYKLD